MKGNADEVLDGILTNGDMIKIDEYIYTYSEEGWSVRVADKTKTNYKEMYDEIFDVDVVNLKECFINCSNLTATPYLSVNAVNLESAFSGCSKIQKAPAIPQGVANMKSAFMWCYKLTEMPVLPEGVTDITQAFFHCYELNKTTELPSTITEMERCFGYSKITQISDIPSGVKSLAGTFAGCEALKTMPKLPEGLENMEEAFMTCLSLTKTVEIPSTVKNMNSTFKYCENLNINGLRIPGKVTNIKDCFVGIKNISGEITFKSTGWLSKSGIEDTNNKLTVYVVKDSIAHQSMVENCKNNSNITILTY